MLILTRMFRCKRDGQLSRPLGLWDVQSQTSVHAARLGTRAHQRATVSSISRVEPGLAALGHTGQKERLGSMQHPVNFVLFAEYMAFTSSWYRFYVFGWSVEGNQACKSTQEIKSYMLFVCYTQWKKNDTFSITTLSTPTLSSHYDDFQQFSMCFLNMKPHSWYVSHFLF